MADTPIEDCLDQILDQLDPEAQSRINKAEETSRKMLAVGAAAVADRLLAAGSTDRTDWAVQPENDARADAARFVFVAHVNELWRQTDGTRPECVQSFLAKVRQLIDPILARHDLAGGNLLDDLLHLCRSNIQLATQRNAAAEASGATEEGQTPKDQTVAPDELTTFLRDHGLLQFSEPWRVRMRQYARLNAESSRHRRRNSSEFARGEQLLQGARAWARAEIGQSVSEVQNVFELKDRIVKKTWDDFVPKPPRDFDLKRDYKEFAVALWEEGWPSLEDHGIAVMAERARSAAKVQSSNQRQAKSAMPGEPVAFVDECAQTLAEQDNGNSVPEAVTTSPDSEKVERAKLRSAWLDQKLVQHKTWSSDNDISTNGRPAYNTIRRFRSGAVSTRDMYVRRQLANAFKCDITEVPA